MSLFFKPSDIFAADAKLTVKQMDMVVKHLETLQNVKLQLNQTITVYMVSNIVETVFLTVDIAYFKDLVFLLKQSLYTKVYHSNQHSYISCTFEN